jgi:hypothetical protein
LIHNKTTGTGKGESQRSIGSLLRPKVSNIGHFDSVYAAVFMLFQNGEGALTRSVQCQLRHIGAGIMTGGIEVLPLFPDVPVIHMHAGGGGHLPRPGDYPAWVRQNGRGWRWHACRDKPCVLQSCPCSRTHTFWPVQRVAYRPFHGAFGCGSIYQSSLSPGNFRIRSLSASAKHSGMEGGVEIVPC